MTGRTQTAESSDIRVSTVRCANDTETHDYDANRIIEITRAGGKAGGFRLQVEAIRKTFCSELAKHGDYKLAKKAIDPAKKELPAVTWSGTFRARANDALINHSGLLCADLDHLGEQLQDTFAKLSRSPHVWALFRSPSADGLKAVLRVPADRSKHMGSYRAVEKYVKELTGVQIDQACKDVARLCFLSYDPQTFHNPNAIEIQPLAEPEKPRAANSAGVDLTARQRIAGEMLGSIDWESETSGFIPCPGERLHTTGNGVRDCKIDLDQAPTVHCFHNSCRGILDGVNHELRSRIGKAERANEKQFEGNGEERPERPPPEAGAPGASSEINPGPYTVDGGCICKIHYSDKGGVTYEPLCNFDAKVAEEILLDDGAEATRAFIINGKLSDGKILPPCRIPASRFAGMSWVTESWGLRAVVNAGNTKRDSLREAIQRLSPETKTRQIFTHTGWREIGGKWVYLSGSMAGNDQFEVDLGSELLRYKLPAVSGNQVEAIKTSLKLLDLAPLRITAPLFAACYRAPLVSAFPQDLSIWIEGKTGSMKSTLAGLFLSHFGDFDRIHLPGAWSSTANQLERRAFLLKDSLFVIDDYAPAGLDHREMETKAARLLRAQGNISGRGRLRSDLTERPAFPPRGIIISTGEQHPPGQSLLARTLVIELDQTDIDVQSLTQAQEQSVYLAHAMAGYVTWLAPQMADMAELLRETFRGARTKATAGREHLRIPEAAAHLWLGLHCGLTYAQETEALSSSQAAELGEKCWKAFLEIGQEQAKIVEDEKPTRRFLGVLYTIIAQGRVTLLLKDETPGEPRPGIDFIGWRDDHFLYLLPEATYAAVVRFCRDTGEYFPSRQERLKRDLAKEKISECDSGRFTTTSWIANHTRRVLKLSLGQIKELLGEDLTTPHQSHHFKMGERDGL